MMLTLIVRSCSKAPEMTQADALQEAANKAMEMDIDISSRIPSVTETSETYVVIYPPPERARAGEFRFEIEKSTGEFKDIRIWR